MGWKKFGGEVKGVLVEGDKSVPPTTWWRHLWLKFFGWRTVAVFQVSNEALVNGLEYRVGFKPLPRFGGAQICDDACRGQRFKMLIGREACTFFAVHKDGTEVPIRLVARTSKHDPTYGDARLF